MRTALVLLGLAAAGYAEPVRLGEGARVPESPRSQYSRYVNWRPADGETVRLNPPRMSWPYRADFPEGWDDAAHTFTLQIGSEPELARPLVNVKTWFNFYNTLPVLDPGRTWYWRVGYDVGTADETWSAVRRFRIAADAVAWDRSALADPPLAAMGHPRVLFTAETLPQVRELARTHPASQATLSRLVRQADAVLEKPWWNDFPQSDREKEPRQEFHAIAGDLATVAFVWRLTEDARYAGVVERAVIWASYPPGGRASPEGLGGDGSEDATQGNEFLALLFDWLYQDLTEAQRRTMIGSLVWRVDHIMNNFSWGRGSSRHASGAMLRTTWMREGGGDVRLSLPRTRGWEPFTWEIEVPEGVERIRFEPFNYYTAGEVAYARLRIAPEGEGNLLANGDFAAVAGNGPAGWQANTYRTAASVFHRPDGGPEGAAQIGIACGTAAERGAWGQAVAVGPARKLQVSGWYRTESPEEEPVTPVRVTGGMAGMISSHPFEAAMDTAVCGLVLYEHDPVGKRWFDLILNYLIGVTNGYGPDQGWNEGAGYGSSKMKWLMNATMYFDMTLPEAHFGRNPVYRDLGDWMARIIPVGMDHHAWGNQRNASRGNHLANFRKLAFLTGEGQPLYNWQQYGGEVFSPWRAWIELLLPARYAEPVPEPERETARLFEIAGWAMAASGPPSDPETYRQGAGMIVQCRPSGGHSHSFHSDSSFQLHAFGQMLNHGGGSSANMDAYPFHTMSHNTLLIDGLGQAQPSRGMRHPAYGRIVGFATAPDYTYVVMDPTNCYPSEPGEFRRWSFPIDKVYTERALPHLRQFVRHLLFVKGRYFVIYDEVRCTQPATFTWLYHIRPEEPFRFDPASFTVDYAVGDVRVRLRHLHRAGELVLDDRQGEDAYVNPFTGEDYRALRKDKILCGHSLWVSNARPAESWSFLAVVYPARPGEEIPAIEGLDPVTVRVGEEIITFAPQGPAAATAAFVVDPAPFRRAE